jgi:hypothetical protein
MEFVMALCTRVLVLAEGRISRRRAVRYSPQPYQMKPTGAFKDECPQRCSPWIAFCRLRQDDHSRGTSAKLTRRITT